MENRSTTRNSERRTRKFGAGTMILIGGCVAVAILGIFVGVIVIYGGIQAQ
ncbi:hypothetical protein AAIH46_01350 [Rhizobium sp. 0TCS1.26]|uniref:hypothetical protein n=1 Tax=Rhizobium sp. 0TCS1.26 TaxID=3142623 RepID=UPI003D2A7BA7